jgi:hypothetical protein
MFAAPAHPYDARASDFLLTRSVAGVMRVREVTRAAAAAPPLVPPAR